MTFLKFHVYVSTKVTAPKLSFFKAGELQVKLVIFLFYDLTACNYKTEILLLATALIAHLRSQFNHVFELLICMPRFERINF